MISWLIAAALAQVTVLQPIEPFVERGITTPEIVALWAATERQRPRHPTPADEYLMMGECMAALAEQASRRSDAVQIEVIGHTLQLRPIFAFHVADPSVPVTDEVLVFAGIHATEWISLEVATTWLAELIDRPPKGTRVTVVPLLNPDGRAKVERDLEQGAFHRFRRSNYANVDLNRDFAVNREVKAFWAKIIPDYYSHSKSPLSQPESRAIDALAARGYDRGASLHAFGGYFYMPWSGLWERIPDEDRKRFVSLGRQMEQAQGSHAYRTRQLGRWGFFFRAQGSEVDHMYGEHGIHLFLVELTRSGFDPWHFKRSYTQPFRWYNPTPKAAHVERAVASLRALVRAGPMPETP